MVKHIKYITLSSIMWVAYSIMLIFVWLAYFPAKLGDIIHERLNK